MRALLEQSGWMDPEHALDRYEHASGNHRLMARWRRSTPRGCATAATSCTWWRGRMRRRPRRSRARTVFARFSSEAGRLVEGCDAVIVASPSRRTSRRCESGAGGRPTLPGGAAGVFSAVEARVLLGAAADGDVVLQSAHTARYQSGFLRQVGRALSEDAGEIRHVAAVRAIPPRNDRIGPMTRCSIMRPHRWTCCCTGSNGWSRWRVSGDADGAAAGRAAGGAVGKRAPVSVRVSYTSRLRETR